MEESRHCPVNLAALLLAMDRLVDLDHLLKGQAFRRTIHILHLLLDHVHLPIELVEHNMEDGRAYSRVCGLGPNWTGAPAGDCNPDDVGLFGVSNL